MESDNSHKCPAGTIYNLDKMPLIDLHVHTPGGIMWRSIVEKLAKFQNQDVQQELFNADGSIRYKSDIHSTDPIQIFNEFLQAFDQIEMKYLKTLKDIELAIYYFLEECHQQGLSYIELICSPGHVAQLNALHQNEISWQKITYPDFVEGLSRATQKARDAFGLESSLIMTLLRHEGVDKSMQIIDDLIAYPHPAVVGIHMAGGFEQHPTKDFAPHFKKAQTAGLRLSSHTGEHEPPEEILNTIRYLQVERIGHGVRAIEDPNLLKLIAQNRIGLEICPISNVDLQVYPNIQSHPIRDLFDYRHPQTGAKILLNVNSDDPAFFGHNLMPKTKPKGGNTFENYQCLKDYKGFSDSDLLELTHNAVEMSFAPVALKEKLRQRNALYVTADQLNEQLKQLPHSDELDLIWKGYLKVATVNKISCVHRHLSNHVYPKRCIELSQALLNLHQDYFKSDRHWREQYIVNDRHFRKNNILRKEEFEVTENPEGFSV